MITPIILSGGNGTRLWPLSRKSKPKQFINIIDNETIFKKTLNRFSNINNFLKPIILGNVIHEKLIENDAKNNLIFLEPCVKSTAPAIAMIVEYMMKNEKYDETVIFVPSDAYIKEEQDFIEYILEADDYIKNNQLACFGVKPLYPETGYGYIKLDKKINNNVYLVEKFIEKPSIEKAIEFLKNENYLWNIGIFMSKVSFLYELLLKYQPELMEQIKKTFDKSKLINNKFYINEEEFSKIKEISIDYAIIEKLSSSELFTVSMNITWSDLGSFKSIHDIDFNKTVEKNIIKGKVITNGTENCYIRAQNNIICCSDVSDLVIVEDNGIVLIMNKSKSQNIKNIINEIKNKNLDELLQ